MKKNILYLLLMVVATITSCQKDPDVTDSTLSGQTLSVSLPIDDSSTRVEFTDNESGVFLSWESGDKFTVYTVDGNYVDDFLYVETNDSGNSVFTSATASTTLISGTSYTAIYPSIDSPSTLDAHRTELADRVANQTQSGNSSSDHLNDALRMESEFTYQGASDNTTVAFVHKMAAIRIAFDYDGSIPTKAIFYDGNNASYTLNFENVSETSFYISYFIIEPNSSTESRDLIVEIYSNDADVASSSFSVSSTTAFVAGIQYRLSFADITKYIYTKADLEAFRDLVNAGSMTANAVLMDNIDLNGEEWTPIGTSSSIYYAGIFDGRGLTISNLSINSNSNNQGLFGYVIGGTISNLILDNPQVKGNGLVGAVCGNLTSSSSMLRCGVTNGMIEGSSTSVGGVVGEAYSSSVTACYNTGTVEGSSGAYGVGGVVGCTNSSVTACYNAGIVSSSSSYVGGVIGFSSSSATITACYNTGVVSGNYYVEGVVGYAYSSVAACYYVSGLTYTYGTQLATLTELNNVISTINRAAGSDYFTLNSGNILPSLFGEQITYEDIYIENMTISSVAELKKFRDLVNFGWSPVTVTLTADIDLSGEEWTPIGNSPSLYFTGLFDGGGHTINNLSINSSSNYQGLFGCVKSGSISDLILENPQVNGAGYVGALCGYSSSSISECGVINGTVSGSSNYVGGVVGYSSTSSASITACYNTGSVEGNSYVGGVTGYSRSVIACYNAGSVDGSSTSVGGVAGYSSSSSVTACYNTGNVSSSNARVGGVVGYSSSSVTACYNTGSVYSGSSDVGGVVGYSSTSSASVTACYNTGSVKGISFGGVVGDVDSSSVTACYYLSGIGNYTNYGTASSTLVETMTSSDFPETLNTTAGDTYFEYDTNLVNDNYPILISIDYE